MTDYKLEDNTTNIVNPQGSTFNTDVSGIAEFQADFQSRVESLVKASLIKRPDSISLDYLTAFCLGPVANADTSEGVVSYVWKCRVDNDTKKVYIARENDTRDDWNNETELFSFDDDEGNILEVDIAFEQAGRPVVCASRATGTDGAIEVWLYWFDTTDSAFGFDNFGAGRTPRVILDAPFNITDSDVLFFYLSDTKLVYRQQQDRYGTEIETPMDANADMYIEDVVKLRSGRIRVEIIKRIETTGKYTVDALTSTLYPLVIDKDSFTLSSSPQSGTLVVVVISHIVDIDNLQVSSAPQSATLVDPIITVLTDIENLQVSSLPQSGTLVIVVLTKAIEIENIQITSLPQSGTLVVVVLSIAIDIDNMQISSLPISGTLEVL